MTRRLANELLHTGCLLTRDPQSDVGESTPVDTLEGRHPSTTPYTRTAGGVAMWGFAVVSVTVPPSGGVVGLIGGPGPVRVRS